MMSFNLHISTLFLFGCKGLVIAESGLLKSPAGIVQELICKFKSNITCFYETRHACV